MNDDLYFDCCNCEETMPEMERAGNCTICAGVLCLKCSDVEICVKCQEELSIGPAMEGSYE